MRKIIPVIAFVLMVFTAQPSQAKISELITGKNAPDSFADLVEDLLPAVVNISSTQKADNGPNFSDLPHFPEGSPFEDFFEEFMDRRGGQSGPFTPQASLGSGFVIDAEKGYIVTNNHVIRDADDIKVVFQDDESVEAEVIGTDEKTDIAVLQIKTDKKLTAVDFGDSDVLRVGDWIVAIGNPFGLGGTVTAGIVSARQRDIQSGPYDDYIQTDASINRGNSGGPMFDLDGKVIGINTAIFSPTGGSVGIGFAIPSALAQPVINQIIKYGRTRRGWLGVRIQKVTEEIAESLGLGQAKGALVASVTQDGPADIASIEAGDIILSFNGEDITEMRALPRLVAETEIETNVPVTVWRDGKALELSVKVGELEKAEDDGLIEDGKTETTPDGTEIDETGLSVVKLTASLRETFDIPQGVSGLLVDEITPGSEAARKGLMAGDVIVEMNQQAVEEPEAVESIIEKARKNKRNSVLLLINREGDVRFVALKLGE